MGSDLLEQQQRQQMAQYNEEQRLPAAASLGLDRFLASHTSEDNASFQSILEQDNARRALKAQALIASSGAKEGSFLLEGGEDDTQKKDQPLRITDGYGSSGQPTAGLIGWTYEAKNMVYYSPEGLALSDKEKQALVQGAPKKVCTKDSPG